LAKIDPAACPRTDLVRLLGCPRMDVVRPALTLLEGGRSSVWPEQPPTVAPRYGASEKGLSSDEASPLTTNRLTLARLAGLKILYKNADALAVALAIPLLRDTNSIVRNRSFGLLKKLTGQEISQDDPRNWEQWWSEHEGSFQPRNPGR